MSRGRPKKVEETVPDTQPDEEIYTPVDQISPDEQTEPAAEEVVVPCPDGWGMPSEIKIEVPDIKKIIEETVQANVNAAPISDEPEITERIQTDVMGSDMLWTTKLVAKRYAPEHLAQMEGKERQDALVLTVKYFGVHKTHGAATFASVDVSVGRRYFWCPVEPSEFRAAWEHVKGTVSGEEFLAAVVQAANIGYPILYKDGTFIDL